MSFYMSLLCILFATSIGVGQIIFKLSANAIQGMGGSFAINAILQPMTWVAFGWYGATSFLWLFILMRVPLNKAYPFTLLGSALVPLLSWLFFRERISGSYAVGGVLLLLGLYVMFAAPFSRTA